MPKDQIELIQSLLDKERFDEANPLVGAALLKNPTNARLNAQQGYCHWHFDDFEAARASFERATLCDTDFYEAGVMLVRCLDRLHRFSEALNVGRFWSVRNPNDPALQGLIRGLDRQVTDQLGQWTKSIYAFESHRVEIHGPDR